MNTTHTDHDVLTFGETMVLLAPSSERDRIESAPLFHATIGGAESNCAIGLARLGHSVSWVSRLGNDPFGLRVLKSLRGEGVDVSRVQLSPNEPTGIMFKEPGPGNTSRVFYYRRNSAAASLQAEAFESLKSKFLFVTGITPALSDSNRRLTFEVVDRFRDAGARVVFDPNMRFRLWSVDQARPVFIDLAKRSDVLIPSFIEAEILTGQGEHNAMLDRLRSLGPSQVVLKAGEKGAWYLDRDERGFCPSFPVTEIDPVGAGDAFCAGLISGLLDGRSLAEAVTRGAALGAFCVSTFGDYQGLPDRATLEMFIAGKQTPGR
ncbi:MAG TPA: sugar kinase [Chthoniobacterales bacterium]|jgi:2-dehydro-3-deoxygluconokinase|nr:sugar kinase [Chthoniobacterales bacterium]